MSQTDLLFERKPKPAFVRFERRPEEDKQKSSEYGRYIAKDVDYVIIQSSYGKDTVIYPIPRWLEDTERKVRTGEIPGEYFDQWKKNYEIWIKRQMTPTSGTPIRGWGIISPAQQETIINMDMYTVEDLVKDGAKLSVLDWGKAARNKAITWLQALNDRGPLVQKLAELTTENEQLKAVVADLEAKLNIKKATKEVKETPVIDEPIVDDLDIDINDLLSPHAIKPSNNVVKISERDELVKAYQAKFGKKPQHLMKNETIQAALNKD